MHNCNRQLCQQGRRECHRPECGYSDLEQAEGAGSIEFGRGAEPCTWDGVVAWLDSAALFLRRCIPFIVVFAIAVAAAVAVTRN